MTRQTRDKISALVPAVGSFARNPVEAWRVFYDPDYMKQMLEIAFENPTPDMILLDRVIPPDDLSFPGRKGYLPGGHRLSS